MGFKSGHPLALLFHKNYLIFLKPHGFSTDEFQTSPLGSLPSWQRPELSKVLWFFDLKKRTLEKRELKNSPLGIREMVKIGSRIYLGGYGGLSYGSTADLDDLQPIEFFRDHVVKSIVDGGETIWVGTDKGLYRVRGTAIEEAYLGKESLVTKFGIFDGIASLWRGRQALPRTRYALSRSHVIAANVIGDIAVVSTIKRKPRDSCGGACNEMFMSAGLDVIDLKTGRTATVSLPETLVAVEILPTTVPGRAQVVMENFDLTRSVQSLDLTGARFIEGTSSGWSEDALHGHVQRWLEENKANPSAESDIRAFLLEYAKQDPALWRLYLSGETFELLDKVNTSEEIEKLYREGPEELRKCIIERIGPQKTAFASKLLRIALDRGDYFGETLADILDRRDGPESIEFLKRILREAASTEPPATKNYPLPCPSGKAAAILLSKHINGAADMIVEAAYQPTTNIRVRRALEDRLPLKPEAGMDVLAKALMIGDSAARRRVLEYMCTQREPALHSGIIASLSDADGGVRARAAECYGWQFIKADTPVLQADLKNPDPKVRAVVIHRASAHYSIDLTDDVIPELKDLDVSVRREAAMYLGEFPSPRTVAPLINSLKDSDAEVRAWAAHGLGKTHDRRALLPLKAMLSDSNENVRKRVQEALQAIDSAKPAP